MSKQSITALLATQDPKIVARFWSKITRLADSECWLWNASLRNKGYGAFGYTVAGVSVQDRAHRFSWTLHHGEIPDGLFVLHNCPHGDNPRCANPSHLWLGSNDDNIRDMLAKGRHVPGATHTPAEQCNYKRGDSHHNTKLTPETIGHIRSDRIIGLSFSALAEKYSISIKHAHSIVHRKVWKHVP